MDNIYRKISSPGNGYLSDAQIRWVIAFIENYCCLGIYGLSHVPGRIGNGWSKGFWTKELKLMFLFVAGFTNRKIDYKPRS